MTDLGVVGWFLGGQKSTRAGQNKLCDFFIVLLNCPHRETPENAINKNREKMGFGFFVDFLLKLFDMIFVIFFLLCFWTPIAK
jgi:hypothetical protein